MSNVIIRAALEEVLDAITPTIATAWENTSYNPVTGTPYQRVNMLRAQPENPTRDTFKRETGLLQVSLFYPLDEGPKNAETRAELISAAFPKNLQVTKSGITVTINRTAYIMQGIRDGDRWMIPVRITYYSNIS